MSWQSSRYIISHLLETRPIHVFYCNWFHLAQPCLIVCLIWCSLYFIVASIHETGHSAKMYKMSIRMHYHCFQRDTSISDRFNIIITWSIDCAVPKTCQMITLSSREIVRGFIVTGSIQVFYLRKLTFVVTTLTCIVQLYLKTWCVHVCSRCKKQKNVLRIQSGACQNCL